MSSGKKRKKKATVRVLVSLLFLATVLILVLLFEPTPDGMSLFQKLWEKDTPTETQTQETQEALDTETELAEVSEVYEPKIVTVTISAAGDCTFGPTHRRGYEGTFHEYYDNYGKDYFFKVVKELFEKDDFTLVNLECALTNAEAHMDKEFCLKGRPEYAQILPAASIEGVTMANNHTQDYFEQGLEDTKNAVTQAGVEYAFYDKDGTYTTEDGITIGFVSSSFLSYGADREEHMKNGIARLKEQGVDLIIACCHWGIERTYYPEDYQKNMAHNCIDWGANLVLGCHPHVIQGVEVYQNKPIIYSMGNFCFGGNTNPSDKNSFVYQQSFTFVDGVLQPDIQAKLIPCTISSTLAYNDYQPTIAAGDKKQEIIDLLNTYSKDLSDAYLDEEGNLVVNSSDMELQSEME